MKIATKKKIEGYMFILPGFLYILIILGYPLVYNVVLAFRNVNVKTFASHTDVFVGFQNFIDLFKDPTFRKIFGNTITFTFGCLIFQFTIGFIFALFFSQKFTLAGPIRGLVLVAYMMPMSVTAMLGKNMFDVSSGVINDLLMKIHLIRQPVHGRLQMTVFCQAETCFFCDGDHSGGDLVTVTRTFFQPASLYQCCRDPVAAGLRDSQI